MHKQKCYPKKTELKSWYRCQLENHVYGYVQGIPPTNVGLQLPGVHTQGLFSRHHQFAVLSSPPVSGLNNSRQEMKCSHMMNSYSPRSSSREYDDIPTAEANYTHIFAARQDTGFFTMGSASHRLLLHITFVAVECRLCGLKQNPCFNWSRG